jgi:hypothetical protein
MHHSYRLVMVQFQIFIGTDSHQSSECWIAGRWVECTVSQLSSHRGSGIHLGVWFSTLNNLLFCSPYCYILISFYIGTILHYVLVDSLQNALNLSFASAVTNFTTLFKFKLYCHT